MADRNVILMRGRFSNYNDYVKLVRGVASQFINNDRFVICSYDGINREERDIVVYDVASYHFNSNGSLSGGSIGDEDSRVTLQQALDTSNNPGLVLIVDFFDHDTDEVVEFLDTEIGLKYLTLLYYDKKNRPFISKNNNNIKLLNRFLKVEELNRVHRRSCIIMKRGSEEGE